MFKFLTTTTAKATIKKESTEVTDQAEKTKN